MTESLALVVVVVFLVENLIICNPILESFVSKVNEGVYNKITLMTSLRKLRNVRCAHVNRTVMEIQQINALRKKCRSSAKVKKVFESR